MFESLVTSKNFAKDLKVTKFMFINCFESIKILSVLPTIAIIISLTVFIWQIVKKMTANDNENELEIKVIRALVIARGRGGANLQEIKSMKN